MSGGSSKGGVRASGLSMVAVILVALLQYANAAMSFWRGELVNGAIGCGLGAIVLLMMVGAPRPDDRKPAEAFRHGWRHHKGLMAIGLLPPAVGVWMGPSSSRGWLRVFLLAALGFLAVAALLLQRYRRRAREAEGRPREF